MFGQVVFYTPVAEMAIALFSIAVLVVSGKVKSRGNRKFFPTKAKDPHTPMAVSDM